MGNKGVRVVGIFGILIIVLVMVINIPINPQPNPQVSECELFDNDGSCTKFEYDTIITENLNSIIDAETSFTDIDENTNISLGSEKLVLVTRSVLLDSNQDIVSNSTQSTFLTPVTLLDLNKNILDLGSVQLTFDLLYKKNANVIFNGEIDVLLDDASKGKRFLSYSGQLPTNLVRLNVDKESKLVMDRTKSLTFTLADEGKDWQNGSIHMLEIVGKNMKGQINYNGVVKNFDYGNDVTFYRLEMTVDQNKQVTFDEDHQAVSIFKADGVIKSCGEMYVAQCNPSGRQIESCQGGVPAPLIKIFKNNVLIETTKPPTDFPESGGFKNGVACYVYTGLSRNTEYVFNVNNGEDITIITPKTQKTYEATCGQFGYKSVGGSLQSDRRCTSNFGYSWRN